MDWNAIDEKLIKRGKPLLSLDFLKEYNFEFRIMNNCKISIHLRLQMDTIISIKIILFYGSYSFFYSVR